MIEVDVWISPDVAIDRLEAIGFSSTIVDERLAYFEKKRASVRGSFLIHDEGDRKGIDEKHLIVLEQRSLLN